ncbi:GNAT family N-acetyltransferase [Methanocaldococcus bathoardescens]|uniref:GNAT family N-acetyltransferase n=1 Tax=Methanocaldococcus bathoardescens TaxID=1301915 RepID=UPI002FF5C730
MRSPDTIVVDEKFRGKGIGSKLLAEAEKYCKENGLLRLSLLADKDNKKALKFYKSKGWKFTNLICLRKFFNGEKSD